MDVVRWLIILVFVYIPTLTSCSLGLVGSRTAIGGAVDNKPDAKLEQVIEAIENKDKQALRSVFSERALKEAVNLDENIDYLFEFVQGDIKSWSKMGGPVVIGSVRNGAVGEESSTIYNVETDKQKYLFFLIEDTKYTNHPDYIGLYMLQVIKAEDKSAYFDWGNKTMCAGIWRPKA